MANIVPYLERIRDRFAQPEMQANFRAESFKGPKTMQFVFPDLQRNFTLRIAEDGSATLAEQIVPQPDVKVTISSDTLAGIVDGSINPIQAYITRKLKVAGQMEDLLRLQKLL